MSQYPYGYGQYPAQPPPNQYAYPNPMTYPPPPVYGAPHDPGAVPESYYAMNQNAYAYNQSIPGMPGIPGLGIAGTPTAGSPYHPPPAAASPWGQPTYQNQPSPFAAGAPGAASQYGVPQAAPHHIPPPAAPQNPARTQTLQPPFQNNQPPPRTDVPNPNNMLAQTSNEMEEGELSEGQFEDLYEPRDSVVQSKDKAVAAPIAPAADRSQPGSTVDTPNAGFYTDEDTSTKSRPGAGKAPNEQGQSARERSGSYSPYLSPREIQGDDTPKDTTRSPKMQPSRNTGGLPGFHIQKSNQVRVPGIGEQLKTATNEPNGSAAAKSTPSQNQTANGDNLAAAAPSFKSLTEAKKEAQKAILRLWPMGVKFQHYIDEGIDEKVVKRLFSDLHLDMSTGKPAQPSVAQPQQTKPTEAQKPPPATSSSATEKQPSAQAQNGTKSTTDDKMDKAEARKDRIARLLAEKAAKGPAPVPISTAIPTAAPASVPTAPAVVNPLTTANPSGASTPSTDKPVKSKEEKERLLRERMEALQKARAEKANAHNGVPSQPAAMGAPTGPASAGIPTGPSSAIPTGPASAIPTGPRGARTSLPPTVPTGPRSSMTPTMPSENAIQIQLRPSPGQQPQPDAGPIPGLFLSSVPRAPANQHKRPVAADFVAYDPAPKRAFGQERQDSSLVIDISDGSDEEMDIEMDMDSPTEAPLPLPRTNSAGQRPLSFGKFPPLTDTLRGQNISPAPSSQTPALSKKEQELLAKEKAIEAMRRKIAEAEAKRKAKQASSGAQTPTPAAVTPPEGNGSEASGSNGPRASSVSIVDKVNGPSAQLIAEAVAAQSPKPSEAPQADTPQAELPHSVTAVLPPATVESAAQKKERRKRERAEREKKLQEELARIQAEAAADEDMSDDDVDQVEEASAETQGEVAPIEKQVSEEAQQPSKEPLGGSALDVANLQQASLDVPDTSHVPPLDQDVHEAVEEGEVAETSNMPVADAPLPATQDEETPNQRDVEMEDTRDDSLVVMPENPDDAPVQDGKKMKKALNPNKPKRPFPCLVPGCKKQRAFVHKRDLKKHMVKKHKIMPDAQTNLGGDGASDMDIDTPVDLEQAEDTSMAGEASGPATTVDGTNEQDPQQTDRQRSESYEPPEATEPSTEQIPVPSPSPAVADSPLPNNTGESTGQSTTEELMLAQISDVSQARDKVQEIEETSMREPRPPTAPASKMRFTPYESPLQYFRAYRFHPEYEKTVSGGLKSLTYSNKIDPSKELCPSELEGNECPLGEQCQYQHVGQLNAPDDQILLELGRSDDYTGEQKTKFIKGLRELLQKFRADKVRDFDRIAHGIIEFRNQFLGDKSKILPLEGVTL